MNKNLKKVISAAAALTISASSFAALAVDFPDVDATASYYQAVQELSALDVISGFEDGTFRPDELVTRAQITKMIVDALGYRNAAESAKGMATKFADVASGENGHWASGYIATGVSRGFISGHSDTIFAPDDNVTYVQAQKMLVAALGYDSYAQKAGGWPTGYTAYATQKGITKGVSALAEDQLTRAQVAQMIDNAMDVPVVKMNGMETTVFGDYPKYEEMDGTNGKQYETLFTGMNAYKVYGRVTDTARTNTGLDKSMVTFQVEKADNFDDEEITSKEPRVEDMYFGSTNAESMVRTYAQALIQKNDDDEFTLLSIVPAAANKTVSLLAEDIDTSRTDLSNNVLYFFPTGKSTGSQRYTLADDVDFYLNGVYVGKFTQSDYDNYIAAASADTNMVTLQKETSIGTTSASSDYNVIMITACGTAVVGSVNDKTNTTVINFKKFSDGLKAKMTLQKDDDNYRYSFKLDGEEIDPADLEEFDVLTISYDTADFEGSTFYEVTVSRNVETGLKYKGISSDNKDYTFGSTKYRKALNLGTLKTSSEYDLYFDVNGRIAYAEETADSAKIGILKSFYPEHQGSDDYVAYILTKDAPVEGIKVTLANTDSAFTDAQTIYTASQAQATTADKYAAAVVEYKTTAAGKLTSIEAASVDGTAVSTDDEYKATSSKVGSIRLSDLSVVFDLTGVNNDKSDVKVISASDLKDGQAYTAYGYNKSNSICKFVVITEGAGGIDAESKMVVYLEAGTDADEDDAELVTITIADPEADGEETTLALTDTAVLLNATASGDVTLDDIDKVRNNFDEGDVIIYSTTTDGKVDEIVKVATLPSSFQTLYASQIQAGAASMLNANVTDWTAVLVANSNQDEADVIEGIIVADGTGYGYVALADIKSDATGTYYNTSDVQTLTVADETRVYTYDYRNSTRNHGRITVNDGMMVTTENDNAYEGGDTSKNKYYLSSSDEAQGSIDVDDVVYGIARVVDGDEVQEIYLIIGE